MSALEPHHLAILEKVLADSCVPHLPTLLDLTRPPKEQERKNLSRAFSAFALHNICEIDMPIAAAAVIDDFDDYGVDAIYYHAPVETLYLIQSKLKASDQFSQAEALAFCQGVRKLIKQDFTGFNQNVQNRIVEIEDALDNCSFIQLVVAHTGSGISNHAKTAVEELLADDSHGEERFCPKLVDYDAKCVVDDLRESKAYPRVDTDLWIQKCSLVTEPRTTYFGLASLEDLIKLHIKHDKALYDKNIRTFLGHKTDVNTSIRETLATKPEHFVYLNNGITALCEQIEPKGTKEARAGRKRLRIRGFSVVNGAQTIASSAKFLADNPDANLEAARVSITLIKADADGDFGKSVTRARNHQNPVLLTNFVALHDEQERLRRDLAHLGIHYAYKAEAADGTAAPDRIRVDEAAQALALFHEDPRYVVWLKKEFPRLLDTDAAQYKNLFNASVTAFQLANAVRFSRYAFSRMAIETIAAHGSERLTYKHGNFAFAWILARRVKAERNSVKLFDQSKLESSLSAPADQLRQTLWNKIQPSLAIKGPLSLFKNQTDVIPLLKTIIVEYFGLTADTVIPQKHQKAGDAYPKDLFDYIDSKAPQIGNLT
jgi:hypothetical protein